MNYNQRLLQQHAVDRSFLGLARLALVVWVVLMVQCMLLRMNISTSKSHAPPADHVSPSSSSFSTYSLKKTSHSFAAQNLITSEDLGMRAGAPPRLMSSSRKYRIVRRAPIGRPPPPGNSFIIVPSPPPPPLPPTPLPPLVSCRPPRAPPPPSPDPLPPAPPSGPTRANDTSPPAKGENLASPNYWEPAASSLPQAAPAPASAEYFMPLAAAIPPVSPNGSSSKPYGNLVVPAAAPSPAMTRPRFMQPSATPVSSNSWAPSPHPGSAGSASPPV